MEIKLATMENFEGIKQLLNANHFNTLPEDERADGFLTTSMTDDQLTRLIVDKKAVTVAVEEGRVYAFTFAADWDFWKEWDFFAYMMTILPGYTFDGKALSTEKTYHYGPICVDRSMRSTGLFEKVFAFSLAQMADRYPIMVTFINKINTRSYSAHTRKAGMSELGGFQFNGNNYYLMGCYTCK